MYKVSILIPSMRPKEIRRCINSIHETIKDIEYEIIVISPLNLEKELIKNGSVKHIKFIKETKREGTTKGIEIGYKNSIGEYIFVIPDDTVLQTDCIKNLLKFSEEHKEELFLTGPRGSNLWEIECEETIYGKYYPCNPFIKRVDVEKLGYLFDIEYKNYFQDPDLALRVLHNNGKVEICKDAWCSNHVVLDKLTEERVIENFDDDFNKFTEKWHSIYGKGFKKEPDLINLGVKLVKGGIPMECCMRIIQFIKGKEWDEICKDLINSHHTLGAEYLYSTLGFIMGKLKDIPFLYEQFNFTLQKRLITEFIDRMWETECILNFKTVISKYREVKVENTRNLLMCGLIYLILNIKNSIRADVLFIKNYKNTDIHYEINQKTFHDTKYEISSPNFYSLIEEIDKHNSELSSVDYLELKYIEFLLFSFLPDRDNLKENLFAVVDYFGNKSVDERRMGKTTGYLWWRK